MKIIGGSRNSGKTYRLIELCHESESEGVPSYIVCHSAQEVDRVFRLAGQLKKPVNYPITYNEFRNFRGAPTTDFKFYIDNADYLFKDLFFTPYETVVAVTVDEMLMKIQTLEK